MQVPQLPPTCAERKGLSALLQSNSRIWEEKGDRAVQ